MPWATDLPQAISIKAMTHDPICPRDGHPKICEGDGSTCPVCQCELIAQVRVDQGMIDYAKHLVLDYERAGESWESGYKMGREHEREACIKIVQTVGAEHQNNAGRNVWRNEALAKLGYTGHI